MSRPGLTFIEVYEATFSAVWLYSVSHGASASDAEDVVQEVFVVVHKNLHRFEGRSSIKTWVIGIAVNVIRDFRRRRATRNLGSDLEEFPELAGSAAPPSALLSTKEDIAFLEGVLDRLSDAQREVFVLVDLEEMSVVDAALALETNEDTLRSRLRTARRIINEAVRSRAEAEP
jgi:RNA polymerase sigma-70 factor (ECF subfamily)